MAIEYPVEILAEDEDDGTMVSSKTELEEAVVGHRIVKVDHNVEVPSTWSTGYSTTGTIITLDNGKRVTLVGESDCCAYTEIKEFLLNPELVDHVILGVGTTDGYTTWHIYADMGDILKLQVDWSCGNPFYYAYGFTIRVEEPDYEPKHAKSSERL